MIAFKEIKLAYNEDGNYSILDSAAVIGRFIFSSNNPE